MDRNKAKSIANITGNLHDEVDQVYESLMDGSFDEVTKSINTMMESLKHLKTNLKTDEI